METIVKVDCGTLISNEMSTRKLSNIENQPEILRFVGKEFTKLEKQTKESKEVTSTVRVTPSASSSATASTERTSLKKRG